ncbi:MAG: D-sedoheptulose 7-phosphate isomerase [Cyclobacteriaceae bacterium]|nr:D-sedoheptulose 7-phosphate isomerase [Cyclobacteriaceae bacterium]
MKYQSDILGELHEASSVLEKFMGNPQNLEKIEEAALVMAHAIQEGGKVMSCGNGGSMCDAMHFAEELTGRYRKNRTPMGAIALSDVSHVSCVANDFGYDEIFSRHVMALGREGDALLAISTSGNSPNILKAVAVAKERNIKVVALTGKDGGKLKQEADVCLVVPHEGYADRIQEVHIKIIHIFILLIEKHVLGQV